MKKVRITVPVTGEKFSYVIGQIVEMEDDRADKYAKVGYGEIVKTTTKKKLTEVPAK